MGTANLCNVGSVGGRRRTVEQSGCIIIIDHRTSPAGRGPEASQAADTGVESALCCMTLDELSRMQDVLFDQLRTGLPAVERIAGALECLDARQRQPAPGLPR